MGLIQKFLQWQKKGLRIKKTYENQEEEWNDTNLKSEYVNFHDTVQRQEYLSACMERLGAASESMDTLSGEYGVVTAYLQDIEEIEALPQEIRVQIDFDAKKIVSAEKDRTRYLGKVNRMPDEKYEKLSRMEEEIPDGIKKMTKEEEYQVLVKKDLSRLDSERYAYMFRLEEVMANIANIKGMTQICIGAFVVCMLMLLVMQFGFDMDAGIGYAIVIASAAIALTIFYVKFSDATKEKGTIERGIAKIITLQNKVKIRYVNNKNLLNYLYMKYGVQKASELQELWNGYSEEKNERVKFEKAQEDLVFYKKSLVANLTKYRIKDADIWIKQAVALIDPKEMVEIRHELIGRRQALRTQMEENKKIAMETQEEIKRLVNIYPLYSAEIMEMVSNYEKKFQ